MDMLLEELMADFQERDLPALTPRCSTLPWLEGKIDTVIGMRRAGKTWFCYQKMRELLDAGWKKESLLYLNFEDERMLPFRTKDLKRIPDVFYRRNPHLQEKTCAFFFDEIHEIPGWELFCRRLIDSKNIRLCLTGSSAKLLSREIATSLRGRAISTEIFPFSFREYLLHRGEDPTMTSRPGAKRRSLLENQIRTYILEGGFPEVQGVAPEYRRSILQGYLDVVILRDVVERHGISDVTPLRALIRHIIVNPATRFSVNKFYKDLHSQGVPCGKNTLYEYLDSIMDAYLIFSIEIDARSERKKRVNPKKVYAIDTGLALACSHSLQPNWGHLLENAVFLELRRRAGTIAYYRTKSGREVDFVTGDEGGERDFIQVTLNMDERGTREREVVALSEAMAEKGVGRGTIVTLSHEETIHTDDGVIDVVPAWRWLLKA